jgi:hypothetical protein
MVTTCMLVAMVLTVTLVTMLAFVTMVTMVTELTQVGRRLDGQTDMASPICVLFMHFV